MSKKIAWIQSEKGILASIWSDKGLYELTFPFPTQQEASQHLTTPLNQLQQDLDSLQQEWYNTLSGELQTYFSGRPVTFSVPLDWSGYSDFRRKVLQFTAGIPSGQVATYGGVAKAVGSPKAARAVGGAMHANRTPIVVPCHRVIGSDGSLTGFGGGLPLKRELLALEK